MAEGEPDKITFVTSSGSSYDSYRPSYPPNAVTSLLSSMHLTGTEGNGARVLDLAAGTGKFTELLAAREEGYEILAVEPYGEMRETLKGKGLQGVTVLDGSAEKISGVESESCDGVVVAQVSGDLSSPLAEKGRERGLFDRYILFTRVMELTLSRLFIGR